MTRTNGLANIFDIFEKWAELNELLSSVCTDRPSRLKKGQFDAVLRCGQSLNENVKDLRLPITRRALEILGNILIAGEEDVSGRRYTRQQATLLTLARSQLRDVLRLELEKTWNDMSSDPIPSLVEQAKKREKSGGGG